MSTRQSLDALASARAQNAILHKIILLVAALGAAGMYFAHSLPKTLDIHIAPDMKAGDVVRYADGQASIPDVNVYGFAYYIWQQLNRWQQDGSKNYGEQIFRFQSYLTPSCRAQLEADMKARHQAGELRSRTRHMTEVPGLSYAPGRVIADGSAAWTVLLDMQLMESFRGQQVKDTYIRYPIRVVRFDVDRERNPWRLAVDCYGSHRPQRLDMREVQSAASGKAVELPSQITPAALPTASDVVDPNAAPRPASPQASTPSLQPQP